LGQYASSEAQLAGHYTTRNRTSGKENVEEKIFFSCSAAQREPMAYFMPVRLVYFLTDDFGSHFVTGGNTPDSVQRSSPIWTA
jgi:hypothetical protein